MKHLKSLLAAYRATVPDTTASFADSFDTILDALGSGGYPLAESDRVRKVLVAVIKDMQAEDAKAAKTAEKMAADRADTAAL